MGLVEKIRAQREQWVTAGGHEWQVRRPTLLQLVQWRGEDASHVLRRSLVGWKLRECDLWSGGTGAVPPFDAEAAIEWLEDRPEIFSELVAAINAAVSDALAAREDAEKK